MIDQFRTVYRGGTGEIVEKKSRFIATVRLVESEEEALSCLEALRKKYWDARHNCFVYIIGENQETVRCSDDGEPSGTAGRPMLDVVQGAGLRNVLVVVTRYFGGILLGAGGLTRAYSKSARDALAAAGAAEMGLWATADIPCPYALFERVRGEVTALGGTVDEAEYGADIRLRVSLPAQTAETLRGRLTELSAGSVAMTVTAEEYRPGGRVEI